MQINIDKNMSGVMIGRSWDSVVKDLIAAKSVILSDDEKITEINIKPDYGIMFKIEKITLDKNQ